MKGLRGRVEELQADLRYRDDQIKELREECGRAIDLVAEMLCRPTFPDEACRVAVELTQQDLKHVEDEPGEICRMMIQELTLGPTLGRDPMGTAESLERITPTLVRDFWQSNYHRGRLQVAASGPIDADALAARIDERFAGLGSPEIAGRQNADFTFTPATRHRDKDIKQQHIAITLPGAARDDADFPIEQVLLGVLSGGMSGRLFTEVREKLGLVYWVSAWHEQPRGAGVIHLRASSTPERCGQTYKTLLRELERLSEDLTDEEIDRAKNSLISQMLTHNDITRSRAGGLSEDLFFEGRPIGLAPRLESISAVTRDQVEHYAHGFDLERICVATLGTQAL